MKDIYVIEILNRLINNTRYGRIKYTHELKLKPAYNKVKS